MEIATKEDYLAINAKLDSVLETLSVIQGKGTAVLTSEQIMIKLNVRPRAFTTKVPELKVFGMWKEGRGYLMREADFEKYLKHKARQKG